MNVVIVIFLCIIVYFLANILTVIKEFIKAHIADKNAFDPDYPFYSRDDIFKARREFDRAKKDYQDQSDKYHQYYDAHREEIEKIKKNKDLSEEFKKIVRNYFDASKEYEIKAADFWFYIQSNYGLRNSKMTANEVSDALDEHIRKNLPSRHKNRYYEWLEKVA